MCKEDALKEFLQEYAEVLKAEFDWKSTAPCSPGVSMPGGVAFVLDKDGERIATFHTKWPPGSYNPSMPVSPRDISGAKLFASVVNFLAGIKEVD